MAPKRIVMYEIENAKTCIDRRGVGSRTRPTQPAVKMAPSTSAVPP
jgi:hypothetical protein